MFERVEHIYTNSKKEFEELKQKFMKEFEEHDLSFSIIDSDWNSDKNGYRAQVHYWAFD